MKRLIALFCVFGLIGCGKGQSKGPGKLPIGFLDGPKAGETVRGTYAVAGWALSEVGIRDISIFVDRNLVGTALLGQGRPDLPVHFSAFPNSEWGGFVYQGDTST